MAVTRDANGNLVYTNQAGAPIPGDAVMPPIGPVDMEAPPAVTQPIIMQAEDGTNVQEMPDGSVIINVETGDDDEEDNKKTNFDDNLAEDMDQMLMSSLCADVLEGIEADIASRSQLIETYTKGMDLLGLKPEDRANKQTRKSVSSIRHPILLESIVTFQSNALGEMLPASGPVKIQVIGGNNQQVDETAEALEEDMNAYLMTGTPEYYPDMDRGLFNLGYGGTLFKKVYRHPITKKPASECVMMTDLIVSEDAVSLANAIRVTQRSRVSPADMKRMQISGVWRNVPLSMPTQIFNPVDNKAKNIQGISGVNTRPKDAPHEVYECYTEINPSDWGLPDEGQEEGLYLPYRITIEKDSRAILEIRRNWKEGDKDFKKRQRFVMYGLVPGFGFLCLGFLHLLGNQTRAMTAAWRIMMDGGMFSNFPGGVRVKGTRQTTNEINPGPGEWPEIDTGPMDDIRKALMPLPYKDVSPVFMQFVELVNKNVQGISGAVELQSGEGRTNVPVGTIMAMIEQQTKIMAAVHKRMHHAQATEFGLLKELFEEDPASLTSWNKNPARTWTTEELQRYEMLPVSDPNIPSQSARIMTATALVTLASQNPQIYDVYKVHKRALRTININDIDDFLHPPPPPPPQAGPQNDPAKMASIAQKEKSEQRKAANELMQSKNNAQEFKVQSQIKAAELASKERIANMENETERMRLSVDANEQQQNVKKDLLKHLLNHATNGIDNGQTFGGTEF